MKKSFAALVFMGLLWGQAAAAAGKLDMMAGFYSLQAKAEQGEGRSSGPGSYIATYHYNFFEGLDFSVGYSLFFSNVIAGDIGYGPDLGFTYYPLTLSGPLRLQTDRIQVVVRDTLKPFVNVSFNQRQFQSVEAAYAGLSLALGTEYHWNDAFDLKGMLRYQMLKGPQSSGGTYLDILVGVSFGI